MDPHKACNTDVFTTMKQVKACADSKAYKQSAAMVYGIVGFIVAIILSMVVIVGFVLGDVADAASKPTKYDTKGNPIISGKPPEVKPVSPFIKLFFMIFITGVTYMSYNYGYAQADYNSVLMAYQKDQQELDARVLQFSSRDANVLDLARDRQRERAAYNSGRRTNNGYYGRNSYGSNSYGSNSGFINGFINGFNIP